MANLIYKICSGILILLGILIMVIGIANSVEQDTLTQFITITASLIFIIPGIFYLILAFTKIEKSRLTNIFITIGIIASFIPIILYLLLLFMSFISTSINYDNGLGYLFLFLLFISFGLSLLCFIVSLILFLANWFRNKN